MKTGPGDPTPLFNAMVERMASVQLTFEGDLFVTGRKWT
jgi:hypothetical protein